MLIPKGEVALGKLAQAMAYGAKILLVDGNFDVALSLARDFTARHPITLVNSVNPFRLEGQKTAAFELADDIGEAPDFLFIPVGNAGNITAYWNGFVEYQQAGRTTRLPRMMGFQAEGAAPIVRGHVIPDPQTVATAIRIGNPASWKLALQAVDESSGKIDIVTDEDILTAYRTLANEEGVFCEPASAASVAGVTKCSQAGLLPEGTTVVCTLTGHGLKDPDIAVETSPRPRTVKATREDVLALLRA